MADTVVTKAGRSQSVVTLKDDGTGSAQVDFLSPVGNAVAVELQNPANGDAIYTVPANKTFSGRIVVVGSGTNGTAGVSAATGGTQAAVSAPAGSNVAGARDIVDLSIAGGGSGNAITAVVSGSMKALHVSLVGHVK